MLPAWDTVKSKERKRNRAKFLRNANEAGTAPKQKHVTVGTCHRVLLFLISEEWHT